MYCKKCGCQIEDGKQLCSRCEEIVMEADKQNAIKSTKIKNTLKRWKPDKEGLRSNRGIKIALPVCISITVLAIAATGIRGMNFYKNYNWILHYELSPEEINKIETETRKIQNRVDENETECAQLQERLEYLKSFDVRDNWENALKREIVRISAENQVQIEEMKTEVMKELGYQYTPKYSQRESYDLGLDFRDGLIDEVGGVVEGGSILSSGLKEALNAAADDASFDSILDGAKKGLSDGVSGYIEDKIIGDLGGKILGIYNTTEDVKNKIESMGNVPPEALNQVSDKMEEYINTMQVFVSMERVTQQDIEEVYQALCGYRYLNQTLRAMMSEGTQLVDANDEVFMELMKKFNDNQALLRRYIEISEEEQHEG